MRNRYKMLPCLALAGAGMSDGAGYKMVEPRGDLKCLKDLTVVLVSLVELMNLATRDHLPEKRRS